jgi:hypothetical protein
MNKWKKNIKKHKGRGLSSGFESTAANQAIQQSALAKMSNTGSSKLMNSSMRERQNQSSELSGAVTKTNMHNSPDTENDQSDAYGLMSD